MFLIASIDLYIFFHKALHNEPMIYMYFTESYIDMEYIATVCSSRWI